jgi:hypothetical protein
MKRILAVAFIISLFLIVPSRVLAKRATTKIIIEGTDLARPIEITDRKLLAKFNVWTGPGTFSTQPGFDANTPSFIIDWSQGPLTQLPHELRRYQVSFYSGDVPNDRAIYVVYYAVSPGSEHGYVYLPGKSDEWWRLNVSSITRGVEGKWFHAWSTWERIAIPLIKKARRQASKSRFVELAET